MKGTSGYKHIIKLEELLDLKPNDSFIHTVNKSVIFLYSNVIDLALYMFIKLKLLLLLW